MTYRLTIDRITCLMPSTSVSIDIDDAIDHAERLIRDGVEILGAAATAGTLLVGSPEFAPIPMVGTTVVVAITDVVAAEAGDVLRSADVFLRGSGFLPDDFYITKETDPGDPVEGGDHEDDVLWPSAGENPRTHNKNLGIDETVSPRIYVDLEEGEGVVFWDHDNVGSDDALLAFRALPQLIGEHDSIYANMLEDCSYQVAWSLVDLGS